MRLAVQAGMSVGDRVVTNWPRTRSTLTKPSTCSVARAVSRASTSRAPIPMDTVTSSQSGASPRGFRPIVRVKGWRMGRGAKPLRGMGSAGCAPLPPPQIFFDICRFWCILTVIKCSYAFSALTLLVGQQEGHPACKKLEWWGAGVVICLGRGADLHTAHLMPLPLTISCSSKSRLVLPLWYQLAREVLDKVRGGGGL